MKKLQSLLKPKQKLETDAAKIPSRNDQIVAENSNQLASNNNVQQTAQQKIEFNFSNCSDLHFGKKVEINYNQLTQVQNLNSNSPKISGVSNEVTEGPENRFHCTRTIKRLKQDDSKVTKIFLEIVAESLGSKWETFVRSVLTLKKPLVDYTIMDNKEFGHKHIAYKNLEQYFQQNPDNATVGWIIKTMWKNKFKEEVFYIKEKMKTIDWKVDEEETEPTPSDSLTEMMDSKEELDEIQLDCLAQCIGAKWEDLCNDLNIEKPTADLLEKDYKEKLYKEVTFQTFVYYFQKNPDRKYLGWIVKYLWNAGYYEEMELFSKKLKEASLLG